MVVYNPIAGGLLSGKHSRERAAVGTRLSDNEQYIGRYWHDSMFSAVEALQVIANEMGISLIDLSYRWLMGKSFVDSVIVGVSRVEHLNANVAASAGRLDESTINACDEVWSRLRGPHFKYNP